MARKNNVRREATQAWQLKVPDHTEPKYEEINAWFYTTQAAAKGLKGSTIDYLRNLDGSYNGLSWGQAIARKMMLRWGLKLQLINMASVTKMFDNFARDIAGMVEKIYEEELGRRNYLEEPGVYRALTDEERKEWDKRDAPWRRAEGRVWNLVVPHYTDHYAGPGYDENAEPRGAAEIGEKNDTPD